MNDYSNLHRKMFVFEVRNPELGDNVDEIAVWAWNWDDAAEQAREEADAIYGDDSRLERVACL